jgi:CheY-like chemotaxis protein
VGITQVSPQPEKPARVLLVEDDTELGDDEAHAAAHRLAADLVLDKPFDVDDLRAAVRAAVPL